MTTKNVPSYCQMSSGGWGNIGGILSHIESQWFNSPFPLHYLPLPSKWSPRHTDFHLRPSRSDPCLSVQLQHTPFLHALGGMLLASSEQRPRVLLNILPCTRRFLTTKNYLVQNVNTISGFMSKQPVYSTGPCSQEGPHICFNALLLPCWNS